MNNLIKFEFRKLFKSKSFYICLLICIGLVLLSGLTTKIMVESREAIDLPSKYSMLQGAVSFGNITLISAIYTALFACEDESSNTLKNIYAKGYTRGNVFISKFIVSLLSILIFTFTCMIVAYFFGKTTWSNSFIYIDNLAIDILAQVLLVIAYHSLFFIISFTNGKIGLSIALNIVGPILISMVLTMIDAFLKLDNFKISSYWIDSLLSYLGQTTLTNQNILVAIVMGIIYFFVFITIGFILNKKKEI